MNALGHDEIGVKGSSGFQHTEGDMKQLAHPVSSGLDGVAAAMTAILHRPRASRRSQKAWIIGLCFWATIAGQYKAFRK